MSCDCPTDKLSKPNPNQDGFRPQLLQKALEFLPEGCALLSSSCCWLPTVLDFLLAGSLAANSLEKLRTALLAISILALVWGVRREGLSRRMLARISLCVGLLAWAYVNPWEKVGSSGQHSCH
ncbi:hypothetical protein N7461_003283 [Penicillium sp. DV-2018c]|nr:hypothetical protein N7461_003283 [Penicillium sp. DV-2018c]